MRYAVVLLAVFGLMVVGCGGGTPEEKMEKAKEAMAEGDLDKVIDLCKSICEDEDAAAELKAAAEGMKGAAEAKKALEDAAGDLEEAIGG